MSAAAIICGTAPSLASTRPAIPPMRALSPFRSATVLISLRNQPPIWQPVLADGIATHPYSLSSGAIASAPPPKNHQARFWRVVMPNGMEVPKARAGSLPK
jgi:hypothetical protein